MFGEIGSPRLLYVLEAIIWQELGDRNLSRIRIVSGGTTEERERTARALDDDGCCLYARKLSAGTETASALCLGRRGVEQFFQLSWERRRTVARLGSSVKMTNCPVEFIELDPEGHSA